MALTLVTAPSVEPVTRQEAKDFARITTTADDTLVDALIVAARRQIEQLTRRVLVTQTWDLTLDAFPDGNEQIEVPLPPLQSVTSISYTDTDGVGQTVPVADYVVDTKSEPGRIVPAFSKTWPSTRDIVNAVAVRFVAGFGLAVAVPESLKTAIKLVVATLYEHREMILVGNVPHPVPVAENIVTPYRVFGF